MAAMLVPLLLGRETGLAGLGVAVSPARSRWVALFARMERAAQRPAARHSTVLREPG
jgi:hypothetical protein